MDGTPARLPQDVLIAEIVSHVRKGDAKKQEALEHYRRAGEGLIKLKAECQKSGLVFLSKDHKSGELLRACSILQASWRHLCNFMRLAREWPVDWERWQEICGNKKPDKPQSKAPKPSQEDLEHALKLAAMRDRGATQNEREVAGEKLSRFASTFDLTADVLETKAKQSTDHTSGESTDVPRNTDYPSFDQSYRVWLHRVREHTASFSREELCDLLAGLHATLETRGLDPLGDRPSWERS